MPGKTTLNATNLKALGAERLAALLIEISEGNATAKRRLRLELAGAENPAAVGREVRKRLTATGRSQSYSPTWTGRSARRSLLTLRPSAAPSSVRSPQPMLAMHSTSCGAASMSNGITGRNRSDQEPDGRPASEGAGIEFGASNENHHFGDDSLTALNVAAHHPLPR